MPSRTLRCYLSRGRNQWEAICIDLDITVHAHTYDLAFEELKGTIDTYIEYVNSLPEHRHQDFLNHPSPPTRRAKLALLAKLTKIFQPLAKDKRWGTRLETYHSNETPPNITCQTG